MVLILICIKTTAVLHHKILWNIPMYDTDVKPLVILHAVYKFSDDDRTLEETYQTYQTYKT